MQKMREDIVYNPQINSASHDNNPLIVLKVYMCGLVIVSQ